MESGNGGASPVFRIKRSPQRMTNGKPIEKIQVRKVEDFQELVEVLNEGIQKQIQDANEI